MSNKADNKLAAQIKLRRICHPECLGVAKFHRQVALSSIVLLEEKVRIYKL
jgi:hypothetical protein